MWDTLTKWPSWNGLGHGHQEDENSKSLFSKKFSPSQKSQDWNFIMTLESRIFHDYEFHFDLMIFHLDWPSDYAFESHDFFKSHDDSEKNSMSKNLVIFRGRIALSKRKENPLFRISRHRFSDIQMSQISTFSLKGRLIKLNEWLIKWLLAWLLSIKLKITYHLMKAIFERFVIFDFFRQKEQFFFFHIDKVENFSWLTWKNLLQISHHHNDKIIKSWKIRGHIFPSEDDSRISPDKIIKILTIKNSQ